MKRVLVILSPILHLIATLFLDLFLINIEINDVLRIIITVIFIILFIVIQYLFGRKLLFNSEDDNKFSWITLIMTALIYILILIIPFTAEFPLMLGYIIFSEGDLYYYMGIVLFIVPLISLLIGSLMSKKKNNE